MEESLASQLRRAERENSTVYLMRVPNIADLPLVQPHSVAKCALSLVLSNACIHMRRPGMARLSYSGKGTLVVTERILEPMS